MATNVHFTNASHNVLGFRVPFLHSTTDYFHHRLVLEKDSGFLFLLCLRELDRVALIAFADLYGELVGFRVEQEADIRRIAQHLYDSFDKADAFRLHDNIQRSLFLCYSLFDLDYLEIF